MGRAGQHKPHLSRRPKASLRPQKCVAHKNHQRGSKRNVGAYVMRAYQTARGQGGIVLRNRGDCLPSEHGSYSACNVAFHQSTGCRTGRTGYIVVSDLEHLKSCTTRMESMTNSEYNDRHVATTDLLYHTDAPIKASVLCGADDD